MIKEGLNGAERQIPSQSDPSVLPCLPILDFIISTAELYNNMYIIIFYYFMPF